MDTYITSIYLKNFLSFSDLHYEPSPNMNILFGENGSGKTNVLKTFRFLEKIFSKAQDNYNKKRMASEEIRINELTKHLFSVDTGDNNIYNTYSKVGNDAPIEVCIQGLYCGKKYEYYISLNEKDIIHKEYLKLSIKGKGKLKLLFLKEENKLNIKLYPVNKYNKLIENSINENNNISFISSFRFNYDNLDEYEVLYNEDSLLPEINENTTILSVLTSLFGFQYKSEKHAIGFTWNFKNELEVKTLQSIGDGSDKIVSIFNQEKKQYENLINNFGAFIQELDEYSRGVTYKVNKFESEFIYELLHRKIIDGKELLIPFINESDGTKKFLDMFNIINNKYSNLVLYDELNSYLHDSLVEKYIKLLKTHYNEKQYFITTHNLNVLNYYFLENEEKQIIKRNPIKGLTKIVNMVGINSRENKAYNYKIGKYGGAPNTSDIFYEE